MKCKKARKWLMSESSALTHAQRVKLDQHVQNCEPCRLASRLLDDLQREIQSAKRIGVPQDMTRDIWQNVRLNIDIDPKSKHDIGKARVYKPRKTSNLAWGIPALAAVCFLFLMLWIKPLKILWPNKGLVPSTLDVTIESAQIDGQAAQISIFEIKDPEMTFIWLDRVVNDNGG
jgi:hypothetical protein